MTDKNMDQRIFDEQLRLMEEQSFLTISAGVVLFIVTVGALWSFLPHELLIIWGGLLGLLSLVRYAVLWCWHHKILQKNSAQFIIFSGLSGLLWGGGGYIFLQQNNTEITIFITILIASMTASGLAYLSIYAVVYDAFSIPSLSGLFFHFITIPGSSRYIGIAIFLMLIFNTAFSRQLQKMLKKSIRLSFQNIELVAQLQQETKVAVSAREEAVKNSRAKTKFLAAASHDLRQPLNAMGFFIEALQQEEDPDRSRDLAVKINRSSDSLRELLDSLLDISRIESGSLRPEREIFPIDRLLGLIAGEYRLTCREKNIDFRYVSNSAWVNSDVHMLERIIRNIVENALRHSARSKILLGCRSRGEMVSVEIRDQGPGIPHHMQAKIFEEFYQLSNPERDRRKGLGLGLSVVRGLSRELGHDLSVWSEPGRGVCFKILVPGAVAQAAIDALPETEMTTPPNTTILIVDDDLASLDAMASMCWRWDYHVLTASGLNQALELITAGNRPDIIVTDYRLQQGMTGAEAIDRIRRKMGPDMICPAVIITGDTAPERLRDAQAAGFPLLHKPVLPARLRTVLQNIKPE